MSDNLHGLLDGELSDNETVDLLRSLISDQEQRELFRQQMMLHGALQRNEMHNGLSATEEGEMLARLSTAVGITTTTGFSWAKRISATTWGFIVGALILGSGLGYAGNEFTHDNGVPPTNAAAPPTSVPIPTSPCNCDSAAAASATAVRDSVVRVKEIADVSLRKQVTRAKQRQGISDPTGREAARKLAKKKQDQVSQSH